MKRWNMLTLYSHVFPAICTTACIWSILDSTEIHTGSYQLFTTYGNKRTHKIVETIMVDELAM
jgi:hypothetical protein